MIAAALLVGLALPPAVPAAPAATTGAKAPASLAGPAGVGTATEYRQGAPITAQLSGGLTISPLRSVLRSEPSLPLPGQKVTVVLTVSNTGALPVTALRPLLALVSGTGLCGPLAGPVPALAASLAPGGIASFTWTVSVTAPGSIRVRAQVSATVTGQGGVAGAVERDLTPPAITRLAATLDPERLPVQAGRWFTVTVTVSNTGGTKAAGVLPVVQPVDGVKLVTLLKGPVPAKPQRLEPGESALFTFSYSANGSGRVVFSATVSGEADLSPPGVLSRAGERTGAWLADAGIIAAARAREAKEKLSLLLFPPQPPPPAEPPLLSFERPEEARWETDGYATVAISATHATDGAAAAVATFMVPGDLTVTATGTFRPTITLRAHARGVESSLPIHDWTPFLALKADAWVGAAQPVTLTLGLVDQRGYRWETVRQVPAASATTLAFDLAEPRAARLDLARLSAL